jgi:antitoxin (DNA-binding transcriptional repressor) of toxin-antitoxin stability system
MTTLTITKARANLSAILERVKKGEDIGIVSGDRIVALRPVMVVSTEVVPLTAKYAQREYGLTPAELKRFAKEMDKKIAADRKHGRLTSFDGKFDPSALD